MKRTTGVIAVLLAVLMISALSAAAQERRGRSVTNPAAKMSSTKKSSTKQSSANQSSTKQTFAPRIRGRSECFIVEGLITAAATGAIRIKTATGERATFEIDDQTTVMETGELVSISTMADIELTASDLQVFDRVEIIFEREGSRRLARIITRLQSERDRVAKR